MIIVPAAGDGVRFKEAGYKGPKHLLPLNGKPMIDWVVENVRPLDPDGQVLVADKAKVGKTRGAVETIYKALALAGTSGPVVVANCDQLIELKEDFLLAFEDQSDGPSVGDGLIFTFQSGNPAHSYVQTTKDKIYWIEEKKVVSDRAVSGVYWFKDALNVLQACHEVLAEDRLEEIYFSAAIKRMILAGESLYAVDAPTAILGTPEDFQRFEVALAVTA